MLRKITLVFAFGVVLFLAGVCHAKMYEWVDQNGVLHISSSPPPAEFSDANRNAADFEETNLISETPTEINDTIGRAIVFGRRSCGLTAQMMRGLDINNVPYKYPN